MLGHEPRHVITPAPAAWLVDDRQSGRPNAGQDEGAVAGRAVIYITEDERHVARGPRRDSPALDVALALVAKA